MNTFLSMPLVRAFWQWTVKRGILYALISTPMLSLLIGYFLRWTNFPTATAFTVILAFAVLPIWVLYRRSHSDDPAEPVHHLPRYALYALVPYVVYDLARIPMYYLLRTVFWARWYDFGYELTGQPPDQWSSLLPGMLLHALQGYTLALGFYILYRRHSLVNALAYVWLFLFVMYIWTFPTFVLADYQPPLPWFFALCWAHFWMALAAWYVPKSLNAPAPWNRLQVRVAQWPVLAMLVPLSVFPFAFVAAETATWQFPIQHDIDQANFNDVRLVLQDGPTLSSIESMPGDPTLIEAHYKFSLRFGPRTYRDYLTSLKVLDAGPVQVNGRLMEPGEIVVWCSSYIPELETPHNINNPLDYFPAVARMQFTDIPVECVGPAAAAQMLAAPGNKTRVELQWIANLALMGERGEQARKFEGEDKALSVNISVQAHNSLARLTGSR
jgi:hypothetical protein